MSELGSGTSYQVLARKYRPRSFTQLKAQPILVKTLQNAIFSNRVPHAILLIGQRGVGKTSTARIIAQTLNCENIVKNLSETINPCGMCEACLSIQSGRQLDVIEMDAASNSGIDNIREIVDSSAYKPVSFTYKIFIIDEIHMLSKYAFNALLKVLEEPPPHLKFIFATTEIARLPDTIISRCIRFDLNLFSIHDLKELIKDVCQQEQVIIQEDANALIAFAAGGSARDALSLLDQAINSIGSSITIEHVRTMMGYAQQDIITDLVVALSQHDILKVINIYNTMIEKGASAVHILKQVHHIIYLLVLMKNNYQQENNGLINAAQLVDLNTLCFSISQATLMRLWQSLQKGIEDVRLSHSLIEAGLMVLIRLCYLSDLPDTAQLINWIEQNSNNMLNPSLPNASPSPAVTLNTGKSSSLFSPHRSSDETNTKSESSLDSNPISSPALLAQKSNLIITSHDLINLCIQHKEPILRCNIEKDAVIHHIDAHNHKIIMSLLDRAPVTFNSDLKKFLQEVTGHKWNLVIETNNDNIITLDQQKKMQHAQLNEQITAHPDIKQILEQFPGAIVTDIK